MLKPVTNCVSMCVLSIVLPVQMCMAMLCQYKRISKLSRATIS
jgi:hypothetical protein